MALPWGPMARWLPPNPHYTHNRGATGSQCFQCSRSSKIAPPIKAPRISNPPITCKTRSYHASLFLPEIPLQNKSNAMNSPAIPWPHPLGLQRRNGRNRRPNPARPVFLRSFWHFATECTLVADFWRNIPILATVGLKILVGAIALVAPVQKRGGCASDRMGRLKFGRVAVMSQRPPGHLQFPMQGIRRKWV